MPGIRQLFLDHVAQTSDSPLMFSPVSGQGVYLYDENGKAFLDLISGIAVSAMGHCHPDVIRAIEDQSNKYLHTMVYGEHVQEPQVRLAEFLASVFPGPIDSVFFVNSGSEATEGAMKLARRYTGRNQFVALENAYHGGTWGAMGLMSDPSFSRAYRPLLPGMHYMRLNEMEDLEVIDDRTAAVFMETIQGEAGFRVPDKEYIHAVRQRCSEVGALLILDEIQSGMGRCGSLWAFEQFDIVPDVVLLAKGFGGGMPLGAFAASSEVMASLANNPALGHITTFGGHPVCCAASLANLQALYGSGLISEVEKKSVLFRQQLTHPLIKGFRGYGLMLAVQLETFDQVRRMMELGLKYGYLTDWFLFDELSFRICPPLTISEKEIVEVCRLLHSALDEIAEENGV